MKNTDFTASIMVNATAQEAFNAINNVRAWWSEDFEGTTEKLNGVFTVRFGEVFITSKVTELIPVRKIVWLVTDCNKPWLKDKKEWVGTKISFEISEKDNKTQITFAHIGLVPQLECFDVCSNAWSEYIGQSLWSFIAKGKGKPTTKKAMAKAAK